MNISGIFRRINKPRSMDVSVAKTTPLHPIKERELPVHPGVQLRKLLQTISMPQARLAELMRMQPSQLNEVLNARRPLNMSIAMLLEAIFDIPANVWIRMQNEYDEYFFLHDQVSQEKYAYAREHARNEMGKYVDAVRNLELFEAIKHDPEERK